MEEHSNHMCCQHQLPKMTRSFHYQYKQGFQHSVNLGYDIYQVVWLILIRI